MSPAKDNIVRKIDDYHSNAWNHFHKHFKIFIKKQDDGSLHQLRVSIKRLVALVHFLEYCHPGPDVKQMKPLIKIFKLSGKLRDNRNAHLFCDKFAIQRSVLDKEDAKQKHIFKKLKAKHKRSGDLDLLKAEMKRQVVTVNAAQLKKYLAEIMQQVSVAFGKKMSAQKLHNTRKKMKELTYLCRLGHRGEKEIINKSRFEMLVVLEDVIGDWHDINKFRVSLRAKEIRKRMLVKVKEKEHLLLVETLTLAATFKRKGG